MEKWSRRKQFTRLIIHIGSLFYIAILLFLVMNQQGIIKSIIQKYFEINIQNVLLLFSTEDWGQILTEKLRQMGIELALVIGLQILIVIVGLIFIGWFLWKLKKINPWYFSEKLLVIGYLFFTLSLIIFLTKMGLEAYQTYQIILQRVNALSVDELRIFQEQITNSFSHINFTWNYLVSDILTLLEQLRDILSKTQKIAGVPELLKQSWQHLLILKNWLIGCSVSGIAIVLVGHGVAGVQLIKNSTYIQRRLQRSKYSRQIELNDRLVTVIEQQQLLIEEMAKNKKGDA
ncbi:hypothetical protein [Lactococcus sp. DD01]|uniref:hypothetical protein n=1 Tax=Lactococcus sp. DD01 TaxID=1776443 RepID=UPI0007762B58|nr:hypothetical protein [Lactococcus sp. DD01]KXT59424.1 hypothetical protein LACDD01_02079 [Lactococcus sp. DD01]